MRREQHNRLGVGEAGFTLLEIIVAISILTFGILAVASMQSAAIRGNQLGYRLTEGSTLAQDRLEFLMSRPYNDAFLDIGTNIDDPLLGGTALDRGYTLTYDVADVPGVNAKLITVRVSLQEHGASRTTELRCVRPQLL
ncbi:MAG: prepilin-type N-terminal cleavage/methylation domain-containing protein [Deltaproteobacteria bacterium]|nr:MAG: prepilin-type N-terminal cleavage/methylation domain-containing protein [Deltaproteobacteria bacterium]